MQKSVLKNKMVWAMSKCMFFYVNPLYDSPEWGYANGIIFILDH